MDLPEDDSNPTFDWVSTVIPYEPETLTEVIASSLLQKIFGTTYIVIYPRMACGHVDCGLATIVSGMTPDDMHQVLVDAAAALHPDNRR